MAFIRPFPLALILPVVAEACKSDWWDCDERASSTGTKAPCLLWNGVPWNGLAWGRIGLWVLRLFWIHLYSDSLVWTWRSTRWYAQGQNGASLMGLRDACAVMWCCRTLLLYPHWVRPSTSWWALLNPLANVLTSLNTREVTLEKNYGCTECWKSFSQSSSFIKHQRVHTEENP